MRIERVELNNYKRFSKLTLADIPETARLVVLLGPNGCGKSSLFDAFLTKSHAYRHNYVLESQHANYYQKDPHNVVSFRSQVEVANQITITFHGRQPEKNEWNEIFNIRTAYRNEADFQLDSLRRVVPAVEQDRFNRIIDIDQAVSDNYARLSWKRMADLDRMAPGDMTFERYRRESLQELQEAMKKLFDDPPLVLQDFGGVHTTGVFRFAKGVIEDFHYKNLSAGEKAAFDVLLDMYVKRSEYTDAIYCVDEPEAHTAAALHGKLLECMLDFLPHSAQLWIATHSIGFVRKAFELMQRMGDVSLIDFSGRDLDREVVIKPSKPNRHFWQKAYEVALDDLADLVTPKHIVICEGNRTKADKGFDAACYNCLFAETHPDWLFVSQGSANEVTGSEPLIAVLRAVARGTTITRVIDRDDMTDTSRDEKATSDLCVLGRRELENYLYAPEVLKTFLSANQKEEVQDVVLKTLEELLDGRSSVDADMKKKTQKLFAAIKRETQLPKLGNSRAEFALQHLVPALRDTPSVFLELKGDLRM